MLPCRHTRICIAAVNPRHGVKNCTYTCSALKLQAKQHPKNKGQDQWELRQTCRNSWSNRKGTGLHRTWRCLGVSKCFPEKTASLNVPLLQSEIRFFFEKHQDYQKKTKLCSLWIKLRKIRPLSLATKRNPATKRPQQAAQYKLGNWPALMLRNHPFVAAKIEMIRTKGGMSCTSDKSYETSDGNHRNRASRIKFLWCITSHFATFSNASHIYKFINGGTSKPSACQLENGMFQDLYWSVFWEFQRHDWRVLF